MRAAFGGETIWWRDDRGGSNQASQEFAAAYLHGAALSCPASGG